MGRASDRETKKKPSELAAEAALDWTRKFNRIVFRIEPMGTDIKSICGLFADAADIMRAAEARGLVTVRDQKYFLTGDYFIWRGRDQSIRRARAKKAPTEGEEIRPFRDQHMVDLGRKMEGRDLKKELPGLAWFIARDMLSAAEITAAVWLVDSWECAGAGGCRAVDPTRPIVDTSMRVFDGIDRMDAGAALNFARRLVGAGLWPIVESVVIRDLPIRDVEGLNGWPPKSGKVQVCVQMGLRNLAAGMGLIDGVAA
jgi:hypothetical protein